VVSHKLSSIIKTKQRSTRLLLGKRINPAVFNDYNVGRVLDKAYEIGAIKMFSAISKRPVDVFEVDNRHVSFDTTSVSVFREYDLYREDAQSSILKVTHGHSKDHRPDLKPFLISMLCVDRELKADRKALEDQCKAIYKKDFFCLVYVQAAQQELSKWKRRRPTRPTTFMLMTNFQRIMIIKIGDNRRLNKPFTEKQMEYLVSLKVDPNAFIKPGAGLNLPGRGI
jgi:hypothetical protein